MTMNKLRLNLTSREFEIEGSDDFIALYFGKVSDLFSDAGTSPTPAVSTKRIIRAPSKTKTSKDGSKPTSKGKDGPAVKINPDLNLRGGGNVPSFKAFIVEKKPRSGTEFNTASVYYLEDLMRIEPVTLSDAYTCYREVGEKPRSNFKGAFLDTASKKSWLEVDGNGNLRLTQRGRIMVEHDLPRSKEKAKGAHAG